MNQLKQLLEESISDKLIHVYVNKPIQKNQATKMKVRPIFIKEQFLYQIINYVGKQVFHENVTKEQLIVKLIKAMEETFVQMEISCTTHFATVLVSKNKKVTIKKKKIIIEQKPIDYSHNRTKKYILDADQKIDFLIDLGVQSKEGKIIASKYDKWKQINRYLEFVQDVLPALRKERQITIIDFGCGKSYLTFALYYFLKILNNIDILVIGLDLKEDVINHCNKLAVKYGYENLTFYMGDISNFTKVNQVDMVITLHACDTATDYALAKAVEWGANVIFSVPCCQHELKKQIACPSLEPILKYGLLKDQMSALLTDGIRANILEQCGYDTSVLEFIEVDNTPKNTLIRAIKSNKMKPKKQYLLEEFLEHIHSEVTLWNLVRNKN